MFQNGTTVSRNGTRSTIRSYLTRARDTELTEVKNDVVDVEAMRARLKDRGVSARDLERFTREFLPAQIETAEAIADDLERTGEIRKSWRGAFVTALREGWALPKGVPTFTERQQQATEARRAADADAERARKATAFAAAVDAWVATVSDDRLNAMFAALPAADQKRFRTPLNSHFLAAMYRREHSNGKHTDERNKCHA